jgi:hypothetical protein
VANDRNDAPKLTPDLLELMLALTRALERRGATVEIVLERERKP